MAYDTNRFCWHGLISTDVEKSKAFYAEVIGWKVQTAAMGNDTATMFAAADDQPRAHVMPPPMEGVPSHWNNYLRVDDVDASTKAAVANGGQQIVAPTDLPVGRFSVVTSPSGATISLFHESDTATAAHPPAIDGAFHWTELHSKDVDADVTWLKKTFGYTTESMPMPEGQYTLLKSGEALRGGVMKSMHEAAPSMWLTWIQVDDADDAVARAEGNGGKALSPLMDMPGVGRMAIVSDSTGAVFGVIKPSAAA